MSTRNQSITLALGCGFFVFYLLGIVVVSGFIPPPHPSWGPVELTDYFLARRSRILVGMSICAVASVLYIPWGVAITAQMVRIEKAKFPALSMVQALAAAIGALFFALSPLMWLSIAYRAGHSADTVQVLNDFAWISWIVSWPFFFIQAGAFGLCLLMYPTIAIPRWAGYLSLWFAFSMIPASGIVFFYSGPLAWNGVFALYLPLTLYATWFIVTSYWLWRAIQHESVESAPVASQDAGPRTFSSVGAEST